MANFDATSARALVDAGEALAKVNEEMDKLWEIENSLRLLPAWTMASSL